MYPSLRRVTAPAAPPVASRPCQWPPPPSSLVWSPPSSLWPSLAPFCWLTYCSAPIPWYAPPLWVADPQALCKTHVAPKVAWCSRHSSCWVFFLGPPFFHHSLFFQKFNYHQKWWQIHSFILFFFIRNFFFTQIFFSPFLQIVDPSTLRMLWINDCKQTNNSYWEYT